MSRKLDNFQQFVNFTTPVSAKKAEERSSFRLGCDRPYHLHIPYIRMTMQQRGATAPGAGGAQMGAGWRCVKSEEFGQTFIYGARTPWIGP